LSELIDSNGSWSAGYLEMTDLRVALRMWGLRLARGGGGRSMDSRTPPFTATTARQQPLDVTGQPAGVNQGWWCSAKPPENRIDDLLARRVFQPCRRAKTDAKARKNAI
jgi:hypothetical protein